MLIHPGDTVEDEPLRRHLLTGRIEAVDEQGVRLRPFASDVDTFQDYDSFVPWAADLHRLAHRAGGGRRGQALALPYSSRWPATSWRGSTPRWCSRAPCS